MGYLSNITARVIRGHGVASGMGGDPRYPAGTLALQWPSFARAGVDLAGLFRGTLNLDIKPFRFRILSPDHFIRDVDWSGYIPAENFLFFRVRLSFKRRSYRGYIYMPDPATKTDHFQPDQMIEVIMPKIEGISTGAEVQLASSGDNIGFYLEK